MLAFEKHLQFFSELVSYKYWFYLYKIRLLKWKV